MDTGTTLLMVCISFTAAWILVDRQAIRSAPLPPGTVEYVGQDDSYGLYLQLDHGNGVKSFYAHCNKVCVSKGQSVAVGEKIAEVGSSGAATGPHLHLELKFNKTHLDPIYYIQVLEN